jgi:ABC-type multidrug transport system permease subunit
VSILPEGVRWLGYVAPTADASELIQGALGITSLTTLDWIRSFAVLLAFTLAFMLLAAYKSQWRET